MKYRKLGRTGLDVSVICLGTMTWGRQNTEAEGHEQMDYALTQGINFFDTAELYAVPPTPETQGKTEEIIGTWFAKNKNRDQVILASKIVGEGIAWIRDGAPINRKSILEALEGSLKRLKTDYLDLYQLHWSNRYNYHFSAHFNWQPEKTNPRAEEENFLEILETLDEMVKAGKIRHVGLSNETAWGTMKYLRFAEERGLPRMVSIQNEYSLLNRLHDWDMAEVSMFEDIGLLAWSPLASGMLSGKYLDGKIPAGSRWDIAPDDPLELFRNTPNANDAVRAYIGVAEKHGLDVCQMALAFVNDRPFVTSTIIGATSMEQLKTDIASIEITLSDEVLADIETVRRQYPVPY